MGQLVCLRLQPGISEGDLPIGDGQGGRRALRLSGEEVG